MKQLVLVFAMLFATMSFSQETNSERASQATQSGNYVLGLNSTGLGFSNVEKATDFNAGVSAGVFVEDGLALLANLGYGSSHFNDVNVNSWNYGVGAKYYIADVLPLQLDWNGSTGNGISPNTSYIGTQLGYAWFPFRNFSVEPKLRYSFSTKDEYPDVFSGGVGFNLFF